MKTLRVINAVFLMAMIVGAIVTYGLKHQAEVAAEDVAHLQTAIAAEKDKIRTLNAEWSLLTQPARLEAAVKEHADYFQLQPFSPDQIASINEIPMRTGATVGPTAGSATNPGAAANDAAVKATLARIAAGGALRAR
jgi:hypothetical protein